MRIGDPGRGAPASLPTSSQAGPVGADQRSARAGSALAVLGAALGLLGVVLGAFGAHALRSRVSVEMLEIYRTGVLYQLFHAVALLAVAGISDRLRRPRAVAVLFGLGVVIFSGSLYALAISGVRVWGAVTPLGGLALIAGWAWLLFGLIATRP